MTVIQSISILTLAGLCEDHADERIRALASYFNACAGR
jgi:hypothetical protein